MVFMFIALSVIVFMNYVVYRGLVLTLMVPDNVKFMLGVLIFVCTVIELVSLAFFKSRAIPSWFNTLGLSLFGVSFMLFALTVVYDVFYLGTKKLPFDATRRDAVVKFLNLSAIGVGLIYIIGGFLGGAQKPKIKNVKVKIKNLKNPLKIAQLTDVHIGEYLKEEFLDDIVKRVNASSPDAVVITGDLVDLEITQIEDTLLGLKNLKSKYGTFYVPGNHEYYHGVGPIMEYVESLGIKVLRNENVQFGGINLAGAYDISAFRANSIYKPDIKKALAGIDADLPTVFLAHQPKQIEEFDDKTPVDLMLSGHTHAGQIFPFSLLVRLAQPYLYGLYKHNEKMQIYVSSGAGFWGPPIRFLAPSEIAMINMV